MKKKFKTLVKVYAKDVKKAYKENQYVLGRISGLMSIICNDNMYIGEEVEGGVVLVVWCYPWKYKKIMRVINKQYPGLCDFEL